MRGKKLIPSWSRRAILKYQGPSFILPEKGRYVCAMIEISCILLYIPNYVEFLGTVINLPVQIFMGQGIFYVDALLYSILSDLEICDATSSAPARHITATRPGPEGCYSWYISRSVT